MMMKRHQIVDDVHELLEAGLHGRNLNNTLRTHSHSKCWFQFFYTVFVLFGLLNAFHQQWDITETGSMCAYVWGIWLLCIILYILYMWSAEWLCQCCLQMTSIINIYVHFCTRFMFIVPFKMCPLRLRWRSLTMLWQLASYSLLYFD